MHGSLHCDEHEFLCLCVIKNMLGPCTLIS